MLVLTRRADESVIINDNIVVTILEIDGEKVKIGITAPREIPVLRDEIYQALKDQEILELRLAEGPEPESFGPLRELLASSGGVA